MMMTKQHLHVAVAAGAMLMALTACDGTKFTEQLTGTFMTVTQKGGPTLGYSPSSGVKILTVDGYAFKDLNRNDSLDAYEDWRLSARERAEDLAKRLSTEEIAGLMLYSPHQMVPSLPGMPFPATYGKKSFPESGEEAWAISDQLHEMIADM